MASRMEMKDLPSFSVLCPSAKIHISAPPSHVFDILVRGSTWPDWNSFCPSVQLSQPDLENSDLRDDDLLMLGTKMALTVRMKPESPQSLRIQNVVVTQFEKPSSLPDGAAMDSKTGYKVSWRAVGIPRFLLRADRISECLQSSGPAAEPGCEFRTWEIMAGPMANVVKVMYGQVLQARFEDTAQDLRDFAERTWRETLVEGQSTEN